MNASQLTQFELAMIGPRRAGGIGWAGTIDPQREDSDEGDSR